MSRDPRSNFRKFSYFVLILHLILGKFPTFPVGKFFTSEVISKNPHGGGGGGEVENNPLCL